MLVGRLGVLFCAVLARTRRRRLSQINRLHINVNTNYTNNTTNNTNNTTNHTTNNTTNNTNNINNTTTCTTSTTATTTTTPTTTTTNNNNNNHNNRVNTCLIELSCVRCLCLVHQRYDLLAFRQSLTKNRNFY